MNIHPQSSQFIIMDFPWLKDTVQYDPYEEPDYPEPQMGPENRPKFTSALEGVIHRYRNPVIDKSVRVYTIAQESR